MKAGVPNGDRYGAAGTCVLASGALLYALLGDPPYAYFEFLKWIVVGSGGYSCYLLLRVSRALAPVALVLGSLGLVELLGKMERSEWGPWNWASVGAFTLSGMLILLVGRERPDAGNPKSDKPPFFSWNLMIRDAVETFFPRRVLGSPVGMSVGDLDGIWKLCIQIILWVALLVSPFVVIIWLDKTRR